MTTAEMKAKYGDEEIWVIPSHMITHDIESGLFFEDDEISVPIKQGLKKYRWEVENDPSFRQPIVYAILTYKRFVFTTCRLAGDPRLTGKYSIGTGGHMAPGETVTQTLFRELEEEVGITPDDMISILRVGYILDESSPVNSVHLGIVYVIEVNDRNLVNVRETEKLAGSWVSSDKLSTLYKTDALESWSEIAYKYCI